MSGATNWVGERTADIGGYHRITVQRPYGRPLDITFLRGAPTQLPAYSSADPFGDSTAQLVFPQLSVLDDLTSPELDWLHEDTSVDIWWVPAMAVPDGWDPSASSDTALWTNPLTENADIICPAWVYEPDGHGGWERTTAARGSKVWEGFFSSVDVEQTDTTSSISVSCQGALFQPDATLAKPFYPPRPQTVESLIAGVFSHSFNPSLRTQPLKVQWPAAWVGVAPSWTGVSNAFTPNVTPGAKWTGYVTRQTGSWDHALTSYIANMLAVMIVKPRQVDWGLAPAIGSQWTMRLAHEGDPLYPAGRTPVLMVRDRAVAPAFTLRCGIWGVNVTLTRDATQKENALYGTGTDVAGTTWRNAVISSDGSRTDYRPLAASKLVYPPTGNPALRTSIFLRESYVQYAGMSQNDAVVSASQTLQNSLDPGWAGTITLKVDPSLEFSRWKIRAGDTMVLQQFLGTGDTGLRLHIASFEADVQAGTVTLTVDSRYRDLVSLTEALARTRDALTPAKLLQLNRNSVTIEDIQAPWDYTAGSGFIPKASTTWYAHKSTSVLFPYVAWAKTHPPSNAAWRGYYVTCYASNSDSRKRWAGPIPILMSEKGTIRRSEFFCLDANGNLLPIPFHVSLYYNNGINYANMPNDGKTWSPFIKNAFQSVDPLTGGPTPQALQPDSSIVMAWGNGDQPAGYSPGLKTAGGHPTGLLVDESSWPFDCSSNNPNYIHLAAAGKEPASVITVYAMFYAQTSQTVYFGGRLYRQEPGTDT